jgi:hypothetical protein
MTAIGSTRIAMTQHAGPTGMPLVDFDLKRGRHEEPSVDDHTPGLSIRS